MNIVYIIGNGFDLNLGMKTRYTDFYEYYKLIKSDKSSIKQLKNEILNNYQTWSDLELAIGNYTQKLNSTEEFDEVFEDILDKLSEYLEKEENSFDLNVIDKQLFYH
jgi:cobalamin biosynthesis Mg chelatase CobN